MLRGASRRSVPVKCFGILRDASYLPYRLRALYMTVHHVQKVCQLRLPFFLCGSWEIPSYIELMYEFAHLTSPIQLFITETKRIWIIFFVGLWIFKAVAHR